MNESDSTVQVAASERSYDEIVATLREQVIRRATWVSAGIGLAAVLFGSYTAISNGRAILVPVYVAMYLAVLFLSFTKRVASTYKAATIVILLYVLGVTDLWLFGWGADGRVFLLAFPVMATILLGRREGFFALGLGFVTLLALTWALSQGLIVDQRAFGSAIRPWPSFFSNVIVYLMVGGLLVTAQQVLVSLLISQLGDVLDQSKSLEQQQAALDQRARALQEANYAMQRRAWHLEAGAEVARVITSVFDVDQLLYRAARLISEKFGFYHTGVFLVEEDGSAAVLKAASSEGGQRMLANGHQLSRGEGMVGWVLEHGDPRIALDVGEDAVYFDNPWLPATRSEAALPLEIAGQIRGVLDVQSTEENAFDADDVRSLEYLANQLAVAVENARRLAQETGILEVTNPFYRMARMVAAAREVRDVWEVLLELINEYRPTRAYIFEVDKAGERHLAAELWVDEITFPDHDDDRDLAADTLHLHALMKDLKDPLFVEDLREIETLPASYQRALSDLQADSTMRSLAILPVKLGAQVLAEIVVLFHSVHPFDLAEKQFYMALADTAAVVLENIRLLESTQRRVRRESTARDITDRMRQAPDMASLMRITAESLAQTLGSDGVYVRLGMSAPSGASTSEEAES